MMQRMEREHAWQLRARRLTSLPPQVRAAASMRPGAWPEIFRHRLFEGRAGTTSRPRWSRGGFARARVRSREAERDRPDERAVRLPARESRNRRRLEWRPAVPAPDERREGEARVPARAEMH